MVRTFFVPFLMVSEPYPETLSQMQQRCDGDTAAAIAGNEFASGPIQAADDTGMDKFGFDLQLG